MQSDFTAAGCSKPYSVPDQFQNLLSQLVSWTQQTRENRAEKCRSNPLTVQLKNNDTLQVL